MDHITTSAALSKSGEIERCFCCNSKSVVDRVNFWAEDDIHGKSVVLCLNCRRELFRLLRADPGVRFWECQQNN